MKSNIAEIEFSADKYANISEFNNFLYNNYTHSYINAVITGIIEGIIQVNKRDSYFIVLGMYKVKCSNNFTLFNIHNSLKNNDEFYKYIVNYFNLWHGGENEVFTYDVYNKKDLKQNFDSLIEILYTEIKDAENIDNADLNEFYKSFYNDMCNMLLSPVISL